MYVRGHGELMIEICVVWASGGAGAAATNTTTCNRTIARAAAISAQRDNGGVRHTYSDTRLIDGFDGPTMACAHERNLQLQLPWVRTNCCSVYSGEGRLPKFVDQYPRVIGY